MKHDYDIAIIGAGPAGCSLALQLATAGYRLVLIERQRYPAHKLCGEFLSPETQRSFERLGVQDAIRSASPSVITSTRVTTAFGSVFEEALPAPALGLSRWKMDALLADAAARKGAAVMEGTAVRHVEGDLGSGFTLATTAGTVRARVAAGAFGKRSVLDRSGSRRFLRRRTGIVASKVHLSGGSPPNAIELHAFPGGYCGVSGVEDGRMNVCWISGSDDLKKAGGHPRDMLGFMAGANSHLQDRLSEHSPDWSSLRSVSQVSFAYKGVFRDDICMVGDAAAMIAPLCGDGMAMGLGSAEIAAPLLGSFLDGEMDAADLKYEYERQWRSEFLGRLRLGRLSHAAYTNPLLAGVAVRFLRFMPPARRWLIRNTRGSLSPTSQF